MTGPATHTTPTEARPRPAHPAVVEQVNAAALSANAPAAHAAPQPGTDQPEEAQEQTQTETPAPAQAEGEATEETLAADTEGRPAGMPDAAPDTAAAFSYAPEFPRLPAASLKIAAEKGLIAAEKLEAAKKLVGEKLHNLFLENVEVSPEFYRRKADETAEPLENSGLPPEEQERIRREVAAFMGPPPAFNPRNPGTPVDRSALRRSLEQRCIQDGSLEKLKAFLAENVQILPGMEELYEQTKKHAEKAGIPPAVFSVLQSVESASAKLKNVWETAVYTLEQHFGTPREEAQEMVTRYFSRDNLAFNSEGTDTTLMAGALDGFLASPEYQTYTDLWENYNVQKINFAILELDTLAGRIPENDHKAIADVQAKVLMLMYGPEYFSTYCERHAKKAELAAQLASGTLSGKRKKEVEREFTKAKEELRNMRKAENIFSTTFVQEQRDLAKQWATAINAAGASSAFADARRRFNGLELTAAHYKEIETMLLQLSEVAGLPVTSIKLDPTIPASGDSRGTYIRLNPKSFVFGGKIDYQELFGILLHECGHAWCTMPGNLDSLAEEGRFGKHEGAKYKAFLSLQPINNKKILFALYQAHPSELQADLFRLSAGDAAKNWRNSPQ